MGAVVDLNRFWAADPAYLEEIVRAHGWIVMKVAKRFGEDQDQTEDLFQGVWVRVIRNPRSYRGVGAFEPWLFRVATNLCRDQARRDVAERKRLEKGEREDLFRDFVGKTPFPDERVISEERHAFIREAMKSLPPREAEAINLIYCEQRIYREAAKDMGIEEATVRSLVRKGINRLRSQEKGREDEVS